MNDNQALPTTAREVDLVATPTPMTMIQIAIQHGASVDVLKNLWDLQVQWEAHEARKAYVVAMNAFKANPPIVIKDMLNKQYDSRYSSLANFVNTVNPELSKFGLSACWRPDQTNGISVTCVVTHAQGHSESATLSGPQDDSGKKNPLQQIKSTITYLEGATFQAITGMVASDGSDDDGNGASGLGMPESVRADFVAAIEALTDEPGATDLWKQIAASCKESGDKVAYADLKKAISVKVAAIKKGGAV